MPEEKVTKIEYRKQMAENYIEPANIKKLMSPKIINMKVLD